LDILVNNAGKIQLHYAWELVDRTTSLRAGIAAFDKVQNASTADVSAIRDCIEVNLIGLVQTTTTFLPLLRASEQAVILNVSTEMASNSLQAGPNARIHVVAYNTSKAAVNSYTIALAQELKKEGIKVNAVTPGFTSTKLNYFHHGGKTTRQGAEVLLPWALIDKDGPTCEYCRYRYILRYSPDLCRSVFG
jgi:NAD(P)-dependent dehydrogenase (short-subunit alcohol dehydrogenase family)